MPGTYVKTGGAWVQIDATHIPKANVGGTWKDVKEIHVKSAGAWIRVWPPIAPPTPTNMRFGTTVWSANNRYEVQSVWDPVQTSLADGYQLEITRQGGTNPVTAQVLDVGTNNFYNDVFPGTTGGIVLSYRVRSYKSGYYSPWSGVISATTPGDAGFCRTNFVAPVGDVWGNMYVQIVHDGNANNVYLDMTRKQDGYYGYTSIRRYAIPTVTANYVDKVGTDHYRGPKAGTTNT